MIHIPGQSVAIFGFFSLVLVYKTECTVDPTQTVCLGSRDNMEQVCTQNNCSSGCSCHVLNIEELLLVKKVESLACSQICNASLTCPFITCNSTSTCNQTASAASSVPLLECNSLESCEQIIVNTTSVKMTGTAKSVKQVFHNQREALNEMVCTAKDPVGICRQSCDSCGAINCNASDCEIKCMNCGSINCDGGSICQSHCAKQCHNVTCHSKKCNFVCESGSKCSNFECQSGVEDCALECRRGAACNLTCNSPKTCNHTCALDGLCYTKAPDYVDLHNGQCGICNCTKDIRNCIQRCESPSGRCLALYCNAYNTCEQFSKSEEKSFVLLMKSTAPNGRQVCTNGSECWFMFCNGTNCSLTCENDSHCDQMLCKADHCTFNCKNGALCEMLRCLPGSKHCEYHCDANAKCLLKQCEGDACIGAVQYAVSKASSYRRSVRVFHLALVIFLLIWLFRKID